MYSDPALIREHIIKIRLNDIEANLIDSLVHYTGQQKAPLLRELLLEQARLVLTGDADLARSEAANEVRQTSLFGTY